MKIKDRVVSYFEKVGCTYGFTKNNVTCPTTVVGSLIQIIRAQENFLIAYRLGIKPKEWAFEVLQRATKP